MIFFRNMDRWNKFLAAFVLSGPLLFVSPRGAMASTNPTLPEPAPNYSQAVADVVMFSIEFALAIGMCMSVVTMIWRYLLNKRSGQGMAKPVGSFFLCVFGLATLSALRYEDGGLNLKLPITAGQARAGGLVVLAILAVAAFIAALAFIVPRGWKMFWAWHNRPEKIAARDRRENQVLQRILKGLEDNPDYVTLTNQSDWLAGRSTPEAVEIKAKVDRMLELVRSQEELAALAWVADSLAEIKFRVEPED
jgi:hypothetical protein